MEAGRLLLMLVAPNRCNHAGTSEEHSLWEGSGRATSVLGDCRVAGRRLGLDRVMADEFEAKMLGRVGRGQFAEVKFLKRTTRWHEDEMCFSWSG